MYLISQKESNPYIDKVIDLSDLKDDTLLVFESRHVIECCQILFGCLYVLESVGVVKTSTNFIINRLTDSILSKPLFYKDFISQLSIIADQTIKIDSNNKDLDQIFKNFKYILDNIWFIPYSGIDELAEDAIKEFKKQYAGDDKNE